MTTITGDTDQKTSRRALRRIVGWLFALSLLVGLTGASELFEDAGRIVRNKLFRSEASGQVVVIALDEATVDKYGPFPWKSSVFADLIDRSREAGTSKLLFDMVLKTSVTRDDRHLLANAIGRAGNVYVGHQTRTGGDEPLHPVPARTDLGQVAGFGDISVFYNYAMSVWSLRYGWTVDGRRVPGLATIAAGVQGPDGQTYPIDWSIEADSVPTYSALDVIEGRVTAQQLKGRMAFVGPTATVLDDRQNIPGVGNRPGVYAHAVAAETLLRHPKTHNYGFGPGLALAAAILALVVLRGLARPCSWLGGASLALAALPLPFERAGVQLDIVPAMVFLAGVAIAIGWRRHRLRGLVDTLTGRPNFNALRLARDMRDRPLVACRIINYTQILSTLTGDQEKQLSDQILARLTVGAGDRPTYVGDEGLFAWFADPQTPIAHHIEALHALFRGAVKVDGRSFDVQLVFGVEIGSGRAVGARLGRALAAAEEAAREGLKWQFHNPDRLEDMGWRLSLLSQLDAAISNGELWVAYQPQVDVRTGRVVGAEALARWTHPEKGPISPSEFIAAAEQGDRIDRLTDFVLDDAVATAARINARGIDFEIAVNLSAKILSDRRFPLKVAATLSRHRLPADKLTLELTETIALANGSDIELLSRLRDLGVKISIDDYGTGLSTLEYLKMIPANEIKIDQGFIRAMGDNRSDRMMVQSTISLAHSLNRTVVAEGVEDGQLLELLKQMGCDRAQGFYLGRPTSAQAIMRKMKGPKRVNVA